MSILSQFRSFLVENEDLSKYIQANYQYHSNLREPVLNFLTCSENLKSETTCLIRKMIGRHKTDIRYVISRYKADIR